MEPVAYQNRLSFKNRLARLAWSLVYFCLFRPSPRPFMAWRRFLLRCFGAKMGRGSVVHASVRVWAPWNLEMGELACLAYDVDCYSVAKITLGRRATVSQYAFLCTAGHNIDHPDTPLVTAPITIADNAWVFARAFIGPGVTIAQGAVAAACAVVVKDVSPWTVVGGNPARPIRVRRLPETAGHSAPAVTKQDAAPANIAAAAPGGSPTA